MALGTSASQPGLLGGFRSEAKPPRPFVSPCSFVLRSEPGAAQTKLRKSQLLNNGATLKRRNLIVTTPHPRRRHTRCKVSASSQFVPATYHARRPHAEGRQTAPPPLGMAVTTEENWQRRTETPLPDVRSAEEEQPPGNA